jgi:PncC family amidohydrolase
MEGKNRLKNLLFSPPISEPEKLSKKLFELAKEKSVKLGFIECSTGGFISYQIVRIKGASSIFVGSITPYSNSLKEFFGGDLSDGAVSERAILSLSERFIEFSGADLVVAESSILGPTGSTEKKPVGLSFICVASKKGKSTFVNLFGGKSREEIMRKVASYSFFFAINHIIGWELRTRKVASSFVEYNGKILILKRSKRVGSYRGKWGVVSGHIEEGETEEQTALKELLEETGIVKEDIHMLFKSSSFEISDTKLGIRWEITPFRIIIRSEKNIKIDWEHVDFRWIKPSEINNFKTAPLLYEGYLKTIFSGRKIEI